MNFDFFQQAKVIFLTPDDLLTKTECEEALKSMNADKTPGTDGLPAEFYNAFGMTFLLIYSPPSVLLTNPAACLLLKEGVSLNLFQKKRA